MVNFAISLVATAATNVINFINTNKRLPDYVTINNTQITMPDFLYMLVTSIIQLNQNNDTVITLKNVSPATKPTSNFKGGSNLQKSEYLAVAQSIQTFIDANSIEPNYATTTIGTLASDDLVYIYTQIMDFFNVNKRLPEYVTVNSIPVVSVIPAPTAAEGSDLWVKQYVEWKTQTPINNVGDLQNIAMNKGLIYADFLNFKHTQIQSVTTDLWTDGINCAEVCQYVGGPILNCLGFVAGKDYWIVHSYVTCANGKKYGHYFIVFANSFPLNIDLEPDNLKFLDLAGAMEMKRTQGVLICNEGPVQITAYMTSIPDSLGKKDGDDKLVIKFKADKKPKIKRTNILKYKDFRIADKITLPDFPFGYEDLVTNPWGMLANGPDPTVSSNFQGVGDCEPAEEEHSDMVTSAMGGNAKVFTSQDALAIYENACGYNPNAPLNPDGSNPTDQGCEMQAVLEYLKQQGVIDSYLELDNNNITEVYESISEFGVAHLGIQLPQIFMDAVSNAVPGQVIIWDVADNDGGILGAHAIVAVEADAALPSSKLRFVKVVGVTAEGDLDIITWGMVVRLTKAAFNKYCDEGWLSFNKDELNVAGVSPEGLDFAALEAAEASIAGQLPAPVNNLTPTYLLVDPVSGKTGDTVNLTATLQDTQNNVGVPNETVSFSVDSTVVGTAVTDANGLATIAYPITQNAGAYEIDVDFTGDTTYDSTEGTNTLTVTGDTPQPNPDVGQAITCIDTAIGCLKQAKTILEGVQTEDSLENKVEKVYSEAVEKIKDVLKDI